VELSFQLFAGKKEVSSVVGLLPCVASGQAFSTAFPLYRMKQLYRCDSVSRASSVGSRWAART
jgi:hypothetical protein